MPASIRLPWRFDKLYNGIRPAEKRDIPSLCRIWNVCFGDGEDYVRFFYRENFDYITTLVYAADDKPVSMLHWFDAAFADGNEELDAKFLYAGGSLPEFRNNGYYTALFHYAENFAVNNNCAIFGKPVRRDIIPYYEKIGFKQDASLKLVTVYPEIKEDFTFSAASAEDYNRMRNAAFSSHPYVKWSDRHVRFCINETAFFGGRTLTVSLDGREYFIMCAPQNENLKVIETNLSVEQIKRIAFALCEAFSVKLLKAYLPDYLCSEGEDVVSSIVYNAPFRNTYVNLILI